jgi:hypothetical protein
VQVRARRGPAPRTPPRVVTESERC